MQECSVKGCGREVHFGKCRLHRDLSSLDLARLGKGSTPRNGDRRVEKCWPGNKAWARFPARLAASIVVLGLVILEGYLKTVFKFLSSGVVGFLFLVAVHGSAAALFLAKLF